MLTVTVLGNEHYDEQKQEFVYPNSYELTFEHSLVSLSKWESKYKKPFLGKDEKSNLEMFDYIYMMLLSPTLDRSVVLELSQENIDEISDYIKDSQTATWFAESKGGSNKQIITSELIYYWMVAYTIPAEYQHWHLNRLLTLIRVCHEHNKPEKKTSQAELAQRQREINRARHAELEAKRKANK